MTTAIEKYLEVEKQEKIRINTLDEEIRELEVENSSLNNDYRNAIFDAEDKKADAAFKKMADNRLKIEGLNSRKTIIQEESKSKGKTAQAAEEAFDEALRTLEKCESDVEEGKAQIKALKAKYIAEILKITPAGYNLTEAHEQVGRFAKLAPGKVEKLGVKYHPKLGYMPVFHNEHYHGPLFNAAVINEHEITSLGGKNNE